MSGPDSYGADCWPWPKSSDIVFEHRHEPWTTKISRAALAHLARCVESMPNKEMPLVAHFSESLCEEVIRSEGGCGLTRNEIMQMARFALRAIRNERQLSEVAILAEREACALIADSVDNHANPMTARDVADAIRARGAA